TYEMSWPELYAAWSPSPAELNGRTYKFTGRLKPDDFMVGKTPVHLLSLEAEWTNPQTGLTSEQWAVMYNSLYNGTMLQTNEGDAMKGVLGRFMAGKPVMYSSDKAMPLPEGTLAKARWDLVRYTSESVGDVLREQAPEVADSLQRLKSEQLSPIEMDLQVGQSQAQLHVSIPVSTLQKLGTIDDALKPAPAQPGVIPTENSPTIPVPEVPGIQNPA
ncbi:MAG TPA: hypothetical protein PLV25_05325, partial [Opitutales bacterium]|nr:hypothetical protein [Opitutales bacterium]